MVQCKEDIDGALFHDKGIRWRAQTGRWASYFLRSLKSKKEGKMVQAKNTGQSKEGTRPRRRHTHLGGSGALDSTVASKPRSVWISAGDFLPPVRGSKLKFWGI